jgi:hypothetical protein
MQGRPSVIITRINTGTFRDKERNKSTRLAITASIMKWRSAIRIRCVHVRALVKKELCHPKFPHHATFNERRVTSFGFGDVHIDDLVLLHLV